MKIVIAHNKIKRIIYGSGFNIAGSKDDLLQIAEQIRAHAERPDFCYGWVQVRDPQPDEHSSQPDTVPFPWCEPP